MHKIIFAIILITISNTASGQKLDWKEIEKSIDKKKNLIDLDNTIETQKQIAFTKNNFAFVGRCLQAQLQIKDLKTEEYFGMEDVYENQIEDVSW